MGTIAGIIAAFAASHLVGMAAGGLAGRSGLLGFGLDALRLAAARRQARRRERARADLQRWLEEAEPETTCGESGTKPA